MAQRTQATQCAFCSAPLPPRSGPGRPRLYCSGQCRARKYMSHHFSVDVAAIIERWGDDCYLCGGYVDRDEPFGPKMLNVDHVIPLSAGGASVLENMRVVHYACNLRKGSKVACPHCREAF